MATSSKGQVAVEFLMYAGLFMIIAIGAYVLTSFTERGEVSLRESQLLSAFGYRFASAPTISYKGGEGFAYDITFPKQLNSRPYNVTYICSGGGSDRSCSVQVAWKPTYQQYSATPGISRAMTLSYTIAPAKYVRGDTTCLDDVSQGGKSGIRMDSGDSNGFLVFNNTGIQPGDEYPTIELYCEVTP
jgi:hypothetical protein